MNNKGLKIIIAVTNDLHTDRRMHKTAISLQKDGHSVLLVGRKLKNSCKLNVSYQVKRFRLVFNTGPVFYACYNIRLFFFLLWHKSYDVILSCDLDTLSASASAAKLRSKKLVYDSHELFTEMPELKERRFIRNIWKFIERTFIPYVDYSFTVSQKIAEFYKNRYGIKMDVIRNLPLKKDYDNVKGNVPLDGKYIIYQGALNKDRGIEKMIEMMDYLPYLKLVIAGDGPFNNIISKIVSNSDSGERIILTGRLDFDTLRPYTKGAMLGLSLEADAGLNYRFSLPNKLFDYIHAETPAIVSDLPEMGGVVRQQGTGVCISPDAGAKEIADKIDQIISDDEHYEQMKNNCQKIKEELYWEKESLKELEVFRTIFEFS